MVMPDWDPARAVSVMTWLLAREVPFIQNAGQPPRARMIGWEFYIGND